MRVKVELTKRISDLQRQLQWAEGELLCADMIDSLVRRIQEVARWREKVRLLKDEIAELSACSQIPPKDE